MMGQATVGGMVVWNKEKKILIKKSYRHYNLESLMNILK